MFSKKKCRCGSGREKRVGRVTALGFGVQQMDRLTDMTKSTLLMGLGPRGGLSKVNCITGIKSNPKRYGGSFLEKTSPCSRLRPHTHLSADPARIWRSAQTLAATCLGSHAGSAWGGAEAQVQLCKCVCASSAHGLHSSFTYLLDATVCAARANQTVRVSWGVQVGCGSCRPPAPLPPGCPPLLCQHV